jgi:hypothetical protein
MSKNHNIEDQPTTGFAKFVKEYQGGRLNQILSMELTKVIDATQKFKGAGALNLTIYMKPVSNSDNETDIVIKYSKKIPEKNSLKSTMFVSPNLQLTGDNPNQLKLFEQKTVLVDEETGEVLHQPVNRDFSEEKSE